MTRPRRIEFANAIYHVISRGSGKQQIFHDNEYYERMIDGLSAIVTRFGWIIYCFVLMPNHFHLLLRTPDPNLSSGMQALLSRFANWYVKRHETVGHVFQGRYKAQLIEDESYFWTASRYIHLNPTRGLRPLVDHPRDWPWSSYQGFEHLQSRWEWVAYDQLLSAWQGDMGGDAVLAYRRFVEAGIGDPTTDPFRRAHRGWTVGSSAFVDRIKKRLGQTIDEPVQPSLHRVGGLPLEFVLSVVAQQFKINPSSFAEKRSVTPARETAALLARELTPSTLGEIAPHFGLAHPESVRALVNRAKQTLATSPDMQARLEQINALLGECDLGESWST